jgi:hypothetical protein
MKRTSKYYDLETIVECKHPAYAAWEPIAAFNSDRVAIHYAVDCRRANAKHGLEYRVMQRVGKTWCLIERPTQ